MRHPNEYPDCMSRVIQLRNVPDDLHRTLKARASGAGMSLSEYLLAEIREIADRLTLNELKQRVELRRPVDLPVSAATTVRGQRRGR